jgi:pimeloyl-ACP methyl ester carboxylesterase
MVPVFSAPWGRAAGALTALALSVATVHAHLIVFKDGFVVEGQVKRESSTLFDEISKEPVVIPKGFFMIDDGVRRVYFSPAQARVVERKAPPAEERITGRPAIWLNTAKVLPPLLEILEVGAWNDRMVRDYRVRSAIGTYNFKQQVRLLTPSLIYVDAPGKFFWSSAYHTREFSPEAVLALLAVAPELQPAKPTGDKAKDAAARMTQRFRVADFLGQAGWYDLAEQELIHIAQDFPEQQQRTETGRKVLARLRARDLHEDIKRLHLAGRLAEARRRLAEFPDKDASDQTLADLRELKATYEQMDARLRESSRLLEELRRLASSESSSVGGETLAAAAAVIGRELGPESVGRLEAFLGQARQWERQQKKGVKSDVGATELLSLAVSGWLLGSAAAEKRPETAVRVWRARQFILEYLRTTSAAAREKMQAGFLKESHYEATLDEVQAMIPRLPPVEPLENTGAQTQEMQVGAGRLTTNYLLRLPPEYRPTRSWPVLIVLHQAGEKPQDMLQRWADQAADNGYILAAPAWERPGAGGRYSYTDRERAAVFETLRDLRRRLQVDSDRVFLFGYGEGGTMAFDVALSHPDLFAGVSTMAAGPELFAKACWRNAQYLPFYVITGNRSGPASAAARQQFDNWILRGFPSLWVDYKGRGVEWFSVEVANIFDWMRPKRRAFPLHQLGADGNGGAFGTEFGTMRRGENRFYWLGTDEVRAACVNDADAWKNTVSPATLTARIDADANEVHVGARGVGQVTLWFGRNAQGISQIDFDRPLKVSVGMAPMWNRKVTPSLGVLLDDLHERGDRHQLFLAKVSLNLK